MFIGGNYFEFDEYYNSDAYPCSPKYKKILVKQFMETCLQELIEKTCHPSRKINWDEEFMEDCKNNFYEGGYEFYMSECRKYL